MRGALLAMVLASGCTHLVWYGRSADRRHVAAVIERGGKQLVRHDLRDGEPFAGIGLEGLQLDAHRVVYPAQLDDGAWVVVDGAHRSARFDAVGAVLLAGGRVSFAAERGAKWFVVREGQPESGPWDEVLAGSLRASSSGQTVAFAARRGGKTFVVVNDDERGPFDAVGQFQFQAERLTFTARTTEGVFVHGPGGGVFGPWEDVVELTTGDGQFAFAARVEKEWKIFRRGAMGPGFERVAGLTFAGARFLFAGRKGGEEFVIDGERQLGPYSALKQQLLVTSAGTLVYAGKRADGWYVIRDEIEASGPWTDVSALVVSGEHDAFIGERDGRSVVVVDGIEDHGWELASGLALSPQGKPLFFARAGAQSLVVDGERTTPFDLVLADTLVFSRDGQHFGCVTGEKKRKQLFITFDDGARVPVDFEELTAAVMRAPPEALLAAPESALLRRWLEAELLIHFSPQEH